MRRDREPSTGPSDEALLAGVAVGDEHAVVGFVRRYQGRVFGLALSMVGEPALAEDIAQETLLRVWRHAPVYDARRGAVSTWVLTIARNLAIDALRVRRATPIDPDDLIGLGLVSREAGPDDAACTADAVAGLKAALRTLPVEQRRAIVLAGFFGLTATEIAASEQIPLGTAKTRVRSALLKLRASMAPTGVAAG